jgi:hypothetical protein
MASIISEKANGSTILLSSVNNNRPILVGIYNGEVVDMAAYSLIAADGEPVE